MPNKSSSCPVLRMLPDQPIDTPGTDELERDRLARSIAKQIAFRECAECMVLGIAGSWGSGKTSLLNLVEHHLKELRRKQTDRSLVIIRFNPWNYSTIEQLISMFFRELRVGLNAVDNAEVVTQIGDALQKLAVLLTPLAAVPGLQAAGLVSSILSPVGSLLKHAAGNRSLETVKRDLNGYLREAGIHLVLIVDDLDRLEPDCVALMLRLLRMNADFDNTTWSEPLRLDR